MFFLAFNIINLQKCFCNVFEKIQITDPSLNVWSMKSLIPSTLIWTPFTDPSTPNPFTEPQYLPQDYDLQRFKWITLGARRRSGSLILLWFASNILPRALIHAHPPHPTGWLHPPLLLLQLGRRPSLSHSPRLLCPLSQLSLAISQPKFLHSLCSLHSHRLVSSLAKALSSFDSKPSKEKKRIKELNLVTAWQLLERRRKENSRENRKVGLGCVWKKKRRERRENFFFFNLIIIRIATVKP